MDELLAHRTPSVWEHGRETVRRPGLRTKRLEPPGEFLSYFFLIGVCVTGMLIEYE